MSDELMKQDDTAEMHKCERRHARDVIVNPSGFPPRHHRWSKASVSVK